MDTILSTFFWATAVTLAAPILVAALGEAVVERSGIFNIGLEGMMLLGAFSAVAGSVLFGSALYGALFAVVSTALVGGIYAIAVVYSRADQIVVGIGFNLMALGVTSMLRRRFFTSEIVVPDVDLLSAFPIPGLSELPIVGPIFFDQSPLVYVGFLLIPATSFLLFRTRFGLLVRAAGDGALSADSHGVPVLRIRLYGLLFGGALAGLAGAILSLTQTDGIFVDNMTGGRGYLAIALAIFCSWMPVRIAVGAVLFGAIDALQYRAQALFGSDIPTAIFLMAPFVVALVVWITLGSSKVTPRDLGQPFVRARS